MGSGIRLRRGPGGRTGRLLGATRIGAIAISVAVAVFGLAAPASAGAGDGMSLDSVSCQDGVPTVVTFIGNQSGETQEFDVLLNGIARPANWPVQLASGTGGLNTSPLPGLIAGLTHRWAMYRQGELVEEVTFVGPQCGDSSYRGYIDYVHCVGVEQAVDAAFANLSAGKTLEVAFAVNGVPLGDLSGAYEVSTNNSGTATLDPQLPPGTSYENTLSVDGVVVQKVTGVAPYCGDIAKIAVEITAPKCDEGNPAAQPVVSFRATNNDSVTHYLELSLNGRIPPQNALLPGQSVTEVRFDETSVPGNAWSAVALATFGNVVAEASGVWPDCRTTTPPPPPDSDGDGVPDSSDTCPSSAGPASNGGCPQPLPPPADTDQDGVVDPQDQCPTVAGPADNGGCPPPPLDMRPAPTVKAAAVAKRGKIKVDVDPNLPKAKYWRFTVEKLASDGVTWKKWRSYRTTTKKEIRYVNPKKGTYRIFVPEQRGYQSAYSTGTVTLVK